MNYSMGIAAIAKHFGNFFKHIIKIFLQLYALQHTKAHVKLGFFPSSVFLEAYFAKQRYHPESAMCASNIDFW